MSDRLDVDQVALSEAARSLRQGAEGIGGAGQPPTDVQAGRLTPVFAAFTARLAEETGNLIGQLGGTAEAVVSAGDTFADVDQDARRQLEADEDPNRQMGPIPPGAV